LITTARKTRHLNIESVDKIDMSKRDKRVYNIVNRGNKIMHTRLKKSNTVDE
jgi:hypothetical protein